MTSNSVLPGALPGMTSPGGVAPRDSLWLRTTASLVAFLVLAGGALFFGIDHFVTREFRALHDERAQRFGAEIRHAAQAELQRLEGLARLISGDRDLNQAAFYHLHLEGEKDHPLAAITRIAGAFKLGSALLATLDGKPIVETGHSLRGMPLPAGRTESYSGMVWDKDRAWMVAGSPLLRDGQPMAWLVLALPLEEVFARSSLGREDAVIRPTRKPANINASAALPSLDQPVHLDIHLPDTAGRALAQVKTLLAVMLALAGAVLALGFGLYLYRQLRPLTQLTEAVGDVGKGDFRRSVKGGGRNEIARLVAAFNDMTRDLAKLRDLERRMRHQEQLSAIGRVAARVAHDINNPLSVISNVSRLLLKESAPAQAEDLKLIVHHSARCMRTVENLLEFGRPINPRAIKLDLAATVADIVGRWHARTVDTPVEMVRPETGVAVLADPLLLEQMLDNLLDNARQAAPGRQIKAEIEAGEGEARLVITDAGPGFSEEALTHLFEPFHTTRRGGTGLGLASCLAVAQAHGGGIAVAPGAPGRVTVSLPYVC